MNIYAIHKFENHDKVENYGKQIKEHVFDAAFCQLSSASKYWKRKTKKIMKKTDIAVYFVGQKFSENIHWELTLAEKHDIPIYLVKINDEIDLENVIFNQLYKINDYNNERKLKYKILTIDELFNLIKSKDDSLQKKLFASNIENTETTLEQYKLMLTTSESLVERRQKISNIYIGVCGILIPIITAFLSTTNLYMIISTPIICLLIFLLCISWIKTITDYGKLNAAKFEIIEEIERKLPLSVFGSEWIALSRRTKRYVSFTQREKFLPKVFIVLSCILFIASIVLLILLLTKVIV